MAPVAERGASFATPMWRPTSRRLVRSPIQPSLGLHLNQWPDGYRLIRLRCASSRHSSKRSSAKSAASAAAAPPAVPKTTFTLPWTAPDRPDHCGSHLLSEPRRYADRHWRGYEREDAEETLAASSHCVVFDRWPAGRNGQRTSAANTASARACCSVGAVRTSARCCVTSITSRLMPATASAGFRRSA